VCGADPEETEFNDEHIIPRWILKKFDLYNESITLINDRKIRYSNYTVPCCKRCNSLLGETLEDEISQVVTGGLDSVNQFVINGGSWKLFLWLSLIFLKTYVKDSYLRKNLDRRMGSETIASDYDWGWMHHIHCMIRAIMSGASIEPECFGTTLVLPAKVSENFCDFDYRDAYVANTVALRLGNVAFAAVLDDSCWAANFFSGHLERITGPVSPLQLLEILTHLTIINTKMLERPSYFTKVDPITGKATIGATVPESVDLDDIEPAEFGEIMYANVSAYIEKMRTPDKSFTAENVKSGRYHFLFDEDGKFIEDSMDLVLMDQESDK
jgi:hypothetical protein